MNGIGSGEKLWGTRELNISSATVGPAGNFIVSISPPIQQVPGRRSVLSMRSAAIWNTSPNISQARGNNTINFSCSKASGGSAVPGTITFPDGGYGVPDICNFFNQQLLQSGYAISPTNPPPNSGTNTNYIQLVPFLTTGTQLILGGNGSVNFTGSAIANVLGFTQQNYTVPAGSSSTTITSQNQANVQLVNSFSIVIPSVINQNFSYSNIGRGINGTSSTMGPSNGIYTSTFSVPYGAQQQIQPFRTTPFPIIEKSINQLTIQILDQDGNVIDFGQGGNYENNAFLINLVIEEYGI